MPFTPLHFGPGLALKGLMPRHFSFSMFALANVAMDIEPLYRMWRIEFPVHGLSHTLAGAVLIGCLAALLGRRLVCHAWRIYARVAKEEHLGLEITAMQAWSGALLGTFTHVFLDGVMHSDMRPFWPLSHTNPLLMPEWLWPMHLACILAGMFGMAGILTRAALYGGTTTH